MQVAVLAGGVGTRLAEGTGGRPKRMVEVGGRPILWHIMKIYSHFGFEDFVIALGYKGEVIKRYMLDYASLHSDLRVELGNGRVSRNGNGHEDWTIDLVDTGHDTATGGPIKRLAPHLADSGTFFLTWGDGVADIDIPRLLEFHRSHGRLATLTAVRPPARFGHLELDGDAISDFSEKPQLGEGWINGAFFVLEPEIFDYIEGDDTAFEREPLERLAREGELMAYRHESFWQCMDTLRDRNYLSDLWDRDDAPWKVWS